MSATPAANSFRLKEALLNALIARPPADGRTGFLAGVMLMLKELTMPGTGAAHHPDQFCRQ